MTEGKEIYIIEKFDAKNTPVYRFKKQMEMTRAGKNGYIRKLRKKGYEVKEFDDIWTPHKRIEVYAAFRKNELAHA